MIGTLLVLAAIALMDSKTTINEEHHHYNNGNEDLIDEIRKLRESNYDTFDHDDGFAEFGPDAPKYEDLSERCKKRVDEDGEIKVKNLKEFVLENPKYKDYEWWNATNSEDYEYDLAWGKFQKKKNKKIYEERHQEDLREQSRLHNEQRIRFQEWKQRRISEGKECSFHEFLDTDTKYFIDMQLLELKVPFIPKERY